MPILFLHTQDGAKLACEFQTGQTLAQAVYLSGLLEVPPLCSGLAACGRCRLRFTTGAPAPLNTETKKLSEQQLHEGWRLGCCHQAKANLHLELPPDAKLGETIILEKNDASSLKSHFSTFKKKLPPVKDPQLASTRLAVDYGSTSIHYRFLASDGSILGGDSMVNPQMGAGSDIMSRLAVAATPEGAIVMQRVSGDALKRMQAQTSLGCITSKNVEEIVVAGNSTMIALLLGRPTMGLARAPYHLEYMGGTTEQVNGLAPLWCAPLISPFVGGDLSAGYAALSMGPQKAEYPYLLADMGTNGEFILALDESRALAASLPLGPALEGIGMRCGAEARPGVITSFAMAPAGLVPKTLEGAAGLTVSKKSPGISGTGYISAVAALLKNGALTRAGHFQKIELALPLAKRLLRNVHPTSFGDEGYFLDEHLYVSASDIEELLKIKSAFTLAMKFLLQEAGLQAEDLASIYLAGALGEHVNLPDMVELGFLPAGLGRKVCAAGNTSLQGAMLLATHSELREALTQWCRTVHTLKLAELPDFSRLFADEMHFGE